MSVHVPSHWFGVGALQPVRVPGDGPVQHGDHTEVTEGAAASLVMEKKKEKEHQHLFTDPHTHWFDLIFVCGGIFYHYPLKCGFVTLFWGAVFKIVCYQMSHS